MNDIAKVTHWNKESYDKYIAYLKEAADNKIKNFNERLISTKKEIIGIKTPKLKNIASVISKSDYLSFLDNVTDTYYEEIMIEGFIISKIKDQIIFDKYFKRFINKIDNWATCDMVISSFKCLKRRPSYYEIALNYISRENEEFICRVGVIMIMDYYLSEDKLKEIFERFNTLNSDKYYVNMAIAWCISVMFIKFKDVTLEFLKHNKLDKFVHNKAIQKIIESLRVDNDAKNYLRTLKKG